MSLTAEPPALYRRNVGLMLINRAGLVFVGQRSDTSAPAWQMPQGGIDEGETPRQAALRELEEEVGTARAEIVGETEGWLAYELPEELRQRMWKGQWRGQAQKWFALRFTGTDADISLETAHPEFSVWRWAPVDTLVDLIVPFKREIYREVVAQLGHHCRPWT